MPILTPEERLGALVGEKYRLESILGRGGMGVVYAAKHEWTNRPVALKLLLTGLGSDPDSASRFLEEARAAARLDHPNVVDVLDMGKDPDGSVYMVLERLEGETFHKLMMREMPMNPQACLEVVLPVMDALGEAHAAGIIHRDIKPSNIFLANTRDGRVPKLLDFGIAKVHGAAHKTTTGIFGTPQYMSPEQARESHSVGPASDVWAMGVVIYYCLSGRLPFEGQSSGEVISRILTERPDTLDSVAFSVPAALGHVVDVALREEPEDRHIDMGTFAEQLRAAASATGTMVTARVAGHGFKSFAGAQAAPEPAPAPAPKVNPNPTPDAAVAGAETVVPVVARKSSPEGFAPPPTTPRPEQNVASVETSLGPTTPFATSTPRPNFTKKKSRVPAMLLGIGVVAFLIGVGIVVYPKVSPTDAMQATPLGQAPEAEGTPQSSEGLSGEETTTAAQEMGTLTVGSRPPCTLNIDGDEVGEADEMPLAAGSYVLECRRAEERQHAQVEIVAGQETTHRFSFRLPGRPSMRPGRMAMRTMVEMEAPAMDGPGLDLDREYD